jgi:Na+/H+ antiporter NhaC
MPPHPYGWLSVAPPLVAIVLAIVTRRVLVSLLAGIAVGALIMAHGDLVETTKHVLETHLWMSLIEPDRLRLFAFTLLMGAMIGVIHVSGGMRGLVNVITPWARSRRSGQLAGWGLGMGVFFDDYANTLLLGGTLQPVFDRLKISREKLAFIVDSTAAPVAALALISTWIAFEVNCLRDGLSNTDADMVAGLQPYALFVACIPYRFYLLQMLLFVLLVAMLGRDFGPMLAAERRAAAGLFSPESTGRFGRNPYDDGLEIHTSHWINALAPLGVTLAVVFWLMYQTGAAELAAAGEASTGFAWARDAFGAADSGLALYYGGLAGVGLAVLIARWSVGIAGSRIAEAAWRGIRVVAPAIAILWFATTMSRMTSNKSADGAATATPYEFQETRLYTGEFLESQLLAASNGDPSSIAAWLPTVVFLLASAVSFCTGTSYGTMGILVPMVVPLASAAVAAAGPAELAANPIFLCSIGSVLAGAVFGDHCSPISDTTILSSQASACDHMAHVVTQLPYALLVGVVATLLGTVLIGFGISVWLLLPLQSAVLIALLFTIGRRAEAPQK